MKTVVHLTTVHIPTDTRILVKQCKSLSAAGYHVTLLYGKSPDANTPPKDKDVEFLAVNRTNSRLGRMTLGALRLFRQALRLRADVYHFHDPELIPVGLLLRLTGARVIYDVHEDYQEAFLYKKWLPNWSRSSVAFAIGWLERLTSGLLSAVVVATPRIAQNFRHANLEIIQNYPRVEEFLDIDTSDYADRPPVVAYIGAISEERSAIEMVDAMEAVGAQVPGARLALGGAFANDSIRQTVEALPGWKHVDFLGWQSRAQLVGVLEQSRLGLIVFHPVGNYVEALSVKMFEYMAAGIPVIASNFPLNRELSATGEFGILVEPKSSHKLAATIITLLQSTERAAALGVVARQRVVDDFNWAAEEIKLLALYRRLLS